MANIRSISLPQAICSPTLFARHTQLNPSDIAQFALPQAGYNNTSCKILPEKFAEVTQEPVKTTHRLAIEATSFFALSPYHSSDGFLYHSTAKSDTGVAIKNRTKCHFKRRVARSHYNERRAVSFLREERALSNYLSSRSNAHSKELPGKNLKYNTGCPSHIEITNENLLTDMEGKDGRIHRSISIDPNFKSKHRTLQSLVLTNAISLTSGQSEATLSEKQLEHNSFTDSNEMRIQIPKPQCIRNIDTLEDDHMAAQPRSQSHHHLGILSSVASPREVKKNNESEVPNDLSSMATSSNCVSSPLNSENAHFDTWYQKYHTVSTHSGRHTKKVMRSPISVLANCRGKLQIAIGVCTDVIRVEVIEGKGLRSAEAPICHSYVKVELVPDKSHSFTKKTQVVENTCNPVFNECVSLDLNKIKQSRRIIISAYCVPKLDSSESEFLGGMSFGVSGILTKMQISGWYYLLNETMARKKHLKAAVEAINVAVSSSSENPNFDQVGPSKITSDIGLLVPSISANLRAISANTPTTISAPTQYITNGQENAKLIAPTTALSSRRNCSIVFSPNSPKQTPLSFSKSAYTMHSMQFHQLLISRGSKGFGFTLAGGCPVYVSHVEKGSPSQLAGIMPGDHIVAINHLNVSYMNADYVVQIFRTSQHPLYLTLGRIPTLPVRLHSAAKSGITSRSVLQLFSKSCFSNSKKPQPTDIPARYPDHNNTASIANDLTRHTSVFMTPSITHLDPIFVRNASGAQPLTHCKHTNMSNSHSSFQLTTNEGKTFTRLRNSLTDGRLCENLHEMECVRFRTPQIASITNLNEGANKSKAVGICETQISTPSELTAPTGDSSYRQHEANPLFSMPQSTEDGDTKIAHRPLVDTSCNVVATVPMNSNRVFWPDTARSVVERLKYVKHVKHVNFCVHSPRLEHHGCLNLLEGNTCSKVDLLLFTDLLLIAQRAPNHFFTVIKDPIYNTKVCYVNIPPYASDQLILQYIDDSNRKQIVHFQGSTVQDWLARIQGHMVYNGNWWMTNISCAPMRF